MDLAFSAGAAVVVLVGLVLELRLFAPGRTPTRSEAIAWSIGWLALALLVAAGIALAGGPAGEWTTVYLIERSLSLDNVFLFALLLAYFNVPAEQRERVIVIGIVGALVLRAIAIVAGLVLIEAIEPVVYGFGVLLLYVAYRALRGAPDRADPGTSRALRAVSRLPATPLLTATAAIVAADIVFAVDSIPAAFAVTRNPAAIWTANAFALLGLGALLVLVDILVRRFRYIDKTIALILAFVGLKILLGDVVHVGDLASLGVILGLLAGGVVVSLVADRRDPPGRAEQAARRPPRCPPELPAPAVR